MEGTYSQRLLLIDGHCCHLTEFTRQTVKLTTDTPAARQAEHTHCHSHHTPTCTSRTHPLPLPPHSYMYKHAPLTSTHFAAIPAPWPAVWGNSTCTPHYTHGMNCSTPPMQRSDFKYYKHIMHWHTLLQTWGRGLTVLLIPPPYRLTHLACPHPTHLASPSHLSGLPHPAPLNPAHMLPHLRPPC